MDALAFLFWEIASGPILLAYIHRIFLRHAILNRAHDDLVCFQVFYAR
jgi:hypothetical protein